MATKELRSKPVLHLNEEYIRGACDIALNFLNNGLDIDVEIKKNYVWQVTLWLNYWPFNKPYEILLGESATIQELINSVEIQIEKMNQFIQSL